VVLKSFCAQLSPLILLAYPIDVQPIQRLQRSQTQDNLRS
jgi:hypothetical protein